MDFIGYIFGILVVVFYVVVLFGACYTLYWLISTYWKIIDLEAKDEKTKKERS